MSVDNMEIPLSIIIPVYNVEKYIGKCLSSIYMQNIDTSLFEVVVVNDGTPDDSMSIVQSYVDRYSNIRIISQTNQGLSVARNNGILQAQGRYVWCVDSDDWLIDGSLNIILSQLDSDYDVLKVLLRRVKEEDGSYTDDNYNKYLIDKTEVIGKDFLFDEGSFAPAQSLIMRRDFVRKFNLSFYPGIYHEDGEFCPRALYLASSVFLMKEPCYNYLLRYSSSIMSTIKIKNFQDLMQVFKNLNDFGDQYVSKNDLKYWRGFSVHILYTIFYWAKSKSFENNNTNAFWDFYKDKRTVFNRYLHWIFYSKHVHKDYLKKFVLLRFFPRVYFKL